MMRELNVCNVEQHRVISLFPGPYSILVPKKANIKFRANPGLA